jgi:DNA-directed RNA polymerase specialized sigma24 family protein
MVAERVEVSGSRELDRARRYEHSALARIFDRHYDPVHGFIFALLGDAVAAEEIASLVFQRLLEALDGITGRGAGLEGWLYATAFALAGDRRRQARPDVAAQALWGLPPAEREVLALRVLAGLDAERIASATGRSAADVLAAEASGLRRLNRALKGER